jgi:hypothetical protein
MNTPTTSQIATGRVRLLRKASDIERQNYLQIGGITKGECIIFYLFNLLFCFVFFSSSAVKRTHFLTALFLPFYTSFA